MENKQKKRDGCFTLKPDYSFKKFIENELMMILAVSNHEATKNKYILS